MRRRALGLSCYVCKCNSKDIAFIEVETVARADNGAVIGRCNGGPCGNHRVSAEPVTQKLSAVDGCVAANKRITVGCVTVGKNNDVLKAGGAGVQKLLSNVKTCLLVGAAFCICCCINSRLKSRKLGRIVEMAVVVCGCLLDEGDDRNAGRAAFR